MQARQREPGRRVVELGVQPGVHRVASFASGRESAAGMVRVGGLLEITGVTRIASGR